MAFDDRTSNFLFLLSLSPLVAGCPAGDDTASGETSGTPTTGSTTAPMTGDGTGIMPTSSAMEGSGGSSTGIATTEADGTTTVDETEGLGCEGTPLPPLMGEVDPLCVAYYQLFNECYYDGILTPQCIYLYAAYCQFDIEYGVMQYGEACGMAQLEFYACLTMLSCEELRGAMAAPCIEQIDAIDAACSPE